MTTNGKKVLIVDDDPVTLTVVSSWLEAEGFEVLTQDTPFGTVKTVTRERPDIVLLDVSMPGLEGSSLAALLSDRLKFPNLGVIFHSSRDLTELRQLAARSGALGGIHKSADDLSFLTQFWDIINKMANGPVRRRISKPAPFSAR